MAPERDHERGRRRAQYLFAIQHLRGLFIGLGQMAAVGRRVFPKSDIDLGALLTVFAVCTGLFAISYLIVVFTAYSSLWTRAA